MAGQIIKKSGTDGTSYDELKAKAVSSLTIVAKTFTWAQVVNVSSEVTSEQALELRDAMDLVYDTYKPCVDSCVSNRASNYGDDGDRTNNSGHNQVRSDNQKYSDAIVF